LSSLTKYYYEDSIKKDVKGGIHIAHICNEYEVLKAENYESAARPCRRWEDNIKMGIETYDIRRSTGIFSLSHLS
jgi:hypothetical protein